MNSKLTIKDVIQVIVVVAIITLWSLFCVHMGFDFEGVGA